MVEPHVSSSDPFSTPDTRARGSWYGVSGIPDVRIDGKYAVVGAGSCVSAANNYRTRINQRLSETGGISPVDISGFFLQGGTDGALQATFELLDPATLTNLRATLYLYEDDITWCCGYGGEDHWDETVRVIQDEDITLAHQGDRVTVVKNITLDPSWNVDELRAVAILQETSGQKTVIQAARLATVHDFVMTVPVRVGSAPTGNGVVYFAGTAQNVGLSPDVLTLATDASFGWPADFQVAGDPAWYTSLAVPLEPGASVDFTVRVQTDGTKRIGTGDFMVTSSNTGRTQPASMRVFNGSYAILFVDDDGAHQTGGVPDDRIFTTALDNLGYLYEHWDVANEHSDATPGLANMLGFDAILWETAYIIGNSLTADDITNLEGYLDTGGKLYLDSMDFLSTQSGPSPFLTDYLGVASWTNNTKCHTARGVGGDPITDGMILPLTFPSETLNRVDTVNPTASASAIFFSETGNPNAVRTELRSNARVVFSTILQNAISQAAPAPNNSETVIERTLSWLLQSSPTGVEPQAASSLTRFVGARPNPFSPKTELSFNLTPRAASGAIRLTLVDPAGRLVRSLVQGRLPSGLHATSWDGLDDGNRPVASGIYFARLKSLDGETSTKLVLAR